MSPISLQRNSHQWCLSTQLLIVHGVKDDKLKAKIARYMTHNWNHLTWENSHCWRGNICIYGFPPLCHTTTIDEKGQMLFKCTSEEEQWIAPHIPEWIAHLDCHIFVDLVYAVAPFAYLFKYMHKGPDCTRFRVPFTEDNQQDDYVEGCYLSAPEATWQILGFHVISASVC